EGIGEPLEAGDVGLAQGGGVALVGGIAEVDTTAQGAGVAGGAAALRVLPGAGGAVVERAGRRRGVGQEQGGLGGREEERMAVFGEPATSAAELARGAELRHVGIERGVEGAQGTPDP